MSKIYNSFISAVLEENYALANKYLRTIVEAKLKNKIKKAAEKVKKDKKDKKVEDK